MSKNISEVDRRRDEALKRALNTPPKPHKPLGNKDNKDNKENRPKKKEQSQ